MGLKQQSYTLIKRIEVDQSNNVYGRMNPRLAKSKLEPVIFWLTREFNRDGLLKLIKNNLLSHFWESVRMLSNFNSSANSQINGPRTKSYSQPNYTLWNPPMLPKMKNIILSQLVAQPDEQILDLGALPRGFWQRKALAAETQSWPCSRTTLKPLRRKKSLLRVIYQTGQRVLLRALILNWTTVQ